MLPRSQLLKKCFSCWKNVPTHLNKSTFSRHMFCIQRWGNAQITGVQDYSSSKSAEFDITQNPYFDKYKEKMSDLQSTDPDEFKSKIEDLKDQKVAAIEKRKQEMKEARAKSISKPSVESPHGSGNWPPRSLDEVMKIDLIKDKTADEIRKTSLLMFTGSLEKQWVIWTEHYAQKDCIFGVVEAINYESLITKSKQCPLFLYPLPRGDGYEFYFTQIHGKDVYFTSLGMYQLLKENAPPCLTVAHFPEFADDKGIVLMAGQYDSKIISKNEAVILVSQMSAYYNPGVGERYNLVRMFNLTPEKFKHLDLIDEYKNLKHTFPS